MLLNAMEDVEQLFKDRGVIRKLVLSGRGRGTVRKLVDSSFVVRTGAPVVSDGRKLESQKGPPARA